MLRACFISFSRCGVRVRVREREREVEVVVKVDVKREVKDFSQQPALKPWNMHVVVGHGAANKLVHAFVP